MSKTLTPKQLENRTSATISELPIGTFFTLKPCEIASEKSVWIRGEYERSSKKYSCTKFDDFCHESFFKGTRVVYINFEF